MSSVETGQMSAVETGQMSAAGQMPAVETRDVYYCDRALPCLNTIHLSCLNSRHLSCLSSSHLSCLNSRSSVARADNVFCCKNRHLSCLNTQCRSIRSPHCTSVEVSEVSIVPISQCSSLRSLNCGNITMSKSQKVGPAPNHQKWPEMGPEWLPGPE